MKPVACRPFLFAIATLSVMAMPEPAAAALLQPDRLDMMAGEEKNGLKVCGIVADYNLSDAVMRVELGEARDGNGIVTVFMRAFQPNSVGPIMRDIWLKTPTLYTLGRFKPARENGNGILEARGALEMPESADVLSEIALGKVEISLVFEGTMPAARLPVGLPSPLPIELAGRLDDCAKGLLEPAP